MGSPKSYNVLLISLVNWDSLIEVPAMLANGGCIVDIYTVPDSWVLQNRFYRNWYKASTEPETFAREVLEWVALHDTEYDWIIPCDDIIIRLLNERITDEALFYRLMPLNKIAHRALLGSKAGFSELCSQYGIRTPGYQIYDEDRDMANIGTRVGFPLLVKVDESEGGYGVYKCADEQELTETLAKIPNKKRMVLQQFIQGYDVNTEVLYRNGQLLVYSSSRTTKVVSKFGPSTEREYYAIPELEPVLIKIGRDFGLSGFGNVVFMYNEPDQNYYLIETDMRPNAWMYYGKFAGNDFSAAINNLINGKTALQKPSMTQGNPAMKIMLYKKDVYRCILEKDWSGLAAWVTNREHRWRYIPFYDHKLFNACTVFLLKFFKDMVAQKIRKTLFRKP